MNVRKLGGQSTPVGRKTLRAAARQVLADLGSSASEVARRLRVAGVNGVTGSPTECAVALYLRAFIGADHRVDSICVQRDWLVVQPHAALRPPFRLSLPLPVSDFIVGFDHGDFPDLVRKQPETAPDGWSSNSVFEGQKGPLASSGSA
jgi:hypothetical protein